MEIIKTILKSAFFMLGCIMMFLALLVTTVDLKSFLWFFSFSLVFFLLSIQYVIIVIKKIKDKIIRILKRTKKENWQRLNNPKIKIDYSNKKIKINNKEYEFKQVESITVPLNKENLKIKDFLRNYNGKKLQIKIGIKVNKVTYRNFNYENMKEMYKDYKKLVIISKK